MADTISTIGSTGDYLTVPDWWAVVSGLTGTHTGRLLNEEVLGTWPINNGSTVGDVYILEPNPGAEHLGRSRFHTGQGAAMVAGGRLVWLFNINGKELILRDLVFEQTGGSDTAIDAVAANSTIIIQEK